VLVVAHLGSVLRKKYPHIVSITDFARWRFGRVVQLYVAALMLLNMFLSLAAEYTAIGNLFVYTLGGSRVPIVLTVAIVTSIYTAAGGLYISILTDVVQGMISVFLLLLLYGYVASTFRPGPLPPLNHKLGSNYWGYSAIICQPLANITGTLFSEGPWQRAWASKNDRALKRGALWAYMLLVVVCFLYGFGGFLAIWSGRPLSDPTGSTAFFTLLDTGGRGAPTWILIVVAVAAVAMNAGDVDTWENAITNTFSAVFLRNCSTIYIRIFVLLINIPAVAVSLQGYNINSLFLVGGTLCTMSAAPILLGMWDRVSKHVTSGATLFGSLVPRPFLVDRRSKNA
jgi:SSS family solute:Na+ symporter